MKGRTRGHGFIAGVACLLVLAALGAVAVAAAPQPLRGKLDRSFGNRGHAAFPLGPTFAKSHFTAMALQPDGGILLAGRGEMTKGRYNEPVGFVQRRTPAGEPDPSFGGGMVQLPDVGGLALQPDGRVLVSVPEGSGICTSTSSVRRLLPNGHLDPSFGQDAKGAQLPLLAYHLAVDAQGRTVAAGGIAPTGPCSHSGSPSFELGLTRLLPDGSLDQSFGNGGILRIPPVSSYSSEGANGLAIREDGTILVAGRDWLRALTPAGAPDPSFGAGGAVELSGSPAALLALPGNRAVLAGSTGDFCCTPQSDLTVSRYLPDGSLDPAFGGGSVVLSVGRTDVPTALAAGPDGSVLVGLEAGSSDGCPGPTCDAVAHVVRFTESGSLDPGFGQGGVATLDLPRRTYTSDYGSYVADLAVSPSGQILAAGSGGGGNATVSALRPDGAPDPSFGSGGRAEDVRTLPSVTEARDLAVAAGGSIFASASSNAGAHRYRVFLLGLEPGGAIDREVGGGTGFVTPEVDPQLLAADGRDRFYAVATASSYRGPGYVARFDKHGRPDPGYGQEGKALLPARFQVRALAVRRNGQALLVGRIARRFGMVAFVLSPYGHPVRRFGGDGLAFVKWGREVKADALAGAFDRRGRVVLFGNVGPRYTGAARLLPNGRLDPSFAYKGRQPYMPGLANEESAVAFAPDGGVLIAAAPEPDLRPLPTTLIRLRPDGVRDRAFGRGGVVRVEARAPMIAFFGGRRPVLVSGADGFGDRGLAIRVFRPDGRLDRSFGRGGVVRAATSKNNPFRPAAAVRQPNGRIVVAGTRGRIEEAGSTVELLRFR